MGKLTKCKIENCHNSFISSRKRKKFCSDKCAKEGQLLRDNRWEKKNRHKHIFKLKDHFGGNLIFNSGSHTRERSGFHKTISEIADEMGMDTKSVQKTLVKGMIKFKANYFEMYGEPVFEDHLDEWDRLCNYIDYENTQDSATGE